MDRNYGFVRVAAAVPAVAVADVRGNCAEISRLIKECFDAGADVAVFPELCVTGYSCGDLFFSKTLQAAAYEGLGGIAKRTAAWDIAAVVGLPVYDGARLLNCAAVLHKGKILGVVPKTYIPDCGALNESRYFASGERTALPEITINGQSAPLGSKLLFDFGAIKLAVEIGEDMRAPAPPSAQHALNGANILCNPSAVSTGIGERGRREMLVRHRSLISHCGYVFASAGLGESTTDGLYCGRALIGENGSILADETPISFESKIICREIDLDRLEADRKRQTAFPPAPFDKNGYKTIQAEHDYRALGALTRSVPRFPFVPSSEAGKIARMREIYDILAPALAKRLRHTGIKAPVIGISGGLDSTLALLIVVRAMDILKLPRSGVVAVTMPGFGTTDRTLKNAKNLMARLGVTAREISIKAACLQHFKDIGHDSANTDVTYENAQARERTQILMDIANQCGGLVIGTGDLSESALGWATYGGDHISMYAVNSGVPKTLVRHLVAWIGETALEEDARAVVSDILDTPVSPELLPAGKDGEIAQKTEEILGDYALHDFFLYYFIRFGFTPEKILFLAKAAFGSAYDEKTLKACLVTFFKRFFANQFKRSCMPDGSKIGSVALSPRAGWRMPSDAEVSVWLENIKD